MAKGEVHDLVRRNVERIRKSRGWTLAALADRMIGDVQLDASALSRIETGARRVDTDDLLAIAAALDVSPLALLLPSQVHPDEVVHVGGTSLEAHTLWKWAIGQHPITDLDSRGFQARSLPWWFRVDSEVPTDGLPEPARTRWVDEQHAEATRPPPEPTDG